MMTLVSRAVTCRADSLPMLADLSADLLDSRRREQRPLLNRDCDPETAFPQHSDLTGSRLDLDPPLLDRDAQRHPGKEPHLVTDGLREDETARRINGCLNGILHGSENTMAGSQVIL
jgi:hypothetical protein